MALHKQIKVDIYKRYVHVIIGTPQDVINAAKAHYPEPEYANWILELERASNFGLADTHYFDGEIIVRFPKISLTPKDISAVTHEMFHVAKVILEYCGVDYTRDSNGESMAYLLEYLVYNALDKNSYEKI